MAPKLGQPRFTPRIRAHKLGELIGHIKHGVSVGGAAELVGVGRRTVYEWLRKGEANLEEFQASGADLDEYGQFAEDFHRARAAPEQKMVGTVVSIATNEDEAGAVRLKAATWWLEKCRPEDYTNRTQHEVAAPGGFDEGAESVNDVILERVSQILGIEDGPAK